LKVRRHGTTKPVERYSKINFWLQKLRLCGMSDPSRCRCEKALVRVFSGDREAVFGDPQSDVSPVLSETK
jgi:hypothetical protein